MTYRLLRLLAVVAAGGITYFAALALLGFNVRDFSRRTG
jgi:putative peptidoglycan lipid II flippase